MGRVIPWVLGALLLLSLAANGFLAQTLWTVQKDFRALAGQFVKVRQELAVAQEAAVEEAVPAQTNPSPAPPAPTAVQPKPVTAPPPSGDVGVIRAAYEPKFLALQGECEGQLTALMAEAKAEYDGAKSQGTVLDVGTLAAKYYVKADGLRKGCDRQVEIVLGQMGADLRASGLPTDLVDEVRETYQAMIVARQAEIMAKAP